MFDRYQFRSRVGTVPTVLLWRFFVFLPNLLYVLWTDTEVKARYEFTLLDVNKQRQNRVKSAFTQFKVQVKNGALLQGSPTNLVPTYFSTYLPTCIS